MCIPQEGRASCTIWGCRFSVSVSWPNHAPVPTPIDEFSSANAGNVAGAAWLSLDSATSHAMKALIVLLLSCASLFAGETLIPLASGQTNMVSYGLSCVVSDWSDATNAPAGSSLVLTLRNTGAKWLDMESVTTDDFSLRDAKGQEMKVYLWTPAPRGMGFGGDTIIHLAVDHAEIASQPWTLNFRSKKALIPIELTIPNINPHKH